MTSFFNLFILLLLNYSSACYDYPGYKQTNMQTLQTSIRQDSLNCDM